MLTENFEVGHDDAVVRCAKAIQSLLLGWHLERDADFLEQRAEVRSLIEIPCFGKPWGHSLSGDKVDLQFICCRFAVLTHWDSVILINYT